MPISTEVQFEVPDGLLQAVLARAMRVGLCYDHIPDLLEEALAWLYETPGEMVPRPYFERNLKAGLKMDDKLQKIREIVGSE
jgi:hypothetical protein